MNTFRFAGMDQLAAYIGAIKPRNRGLVKKMIIDAGPGVLALSSHSQSPSEPYIPGVAWRLVRRECLGLNHLSLVANYEHHDKPPSGTSGLWLHARFLARPPCFAMLRGIEYFDITIKGHDWYPSPDGNNSVVTLKYVASEGVAVEVTATSAIPDQDHTELVDELNQVKPGVLELTRQMSEPRTQVVPNARDADELKTLLFATGLDIWGEGRHLIGDPRPGAVSSRTRANANRRPSAEGTIDHRSRPPGAGAGGHYLDCINFVYDARVGDEASIARFDVRRVMTYRPEIPSERSWVSFEWIITDNEHLYAIMEFYRDIIRGRRVVADVTQLPHPADLIDGLEALRDRPMTAKLRRLMESFRRLATQWGDRSPRADF